MNRIDRIAAILIQLQSRRIVKAQDIADRFSISLRTVYRDVSTLHEAGVPIIGEPGTGYSLGHGYRLPPVMFTMEEATAFLTAEKLIEKLSDKKTFTHYQSALFKIKATLRSTDKDYIENLEEHILVMDNPWLPPAKQQESYTQQLLNSITEQKVVQLHYAAVNSDKPTLRQAEPVGIFFMTGNWYLIAYCLLRKDYRNFRIDRIRQLQNTSIAFQQKHPSLKAYLNSVVKKESELHKVVLLVKKEAVKYLGNQKYYSGYVAERDLGDKVEMTFLTAHPEGFVRWYMMIGDVADILSPQSIKTKAKELATLVLKKLK
jgi:predicted DNA-binding transcriptional regulator YafY